VLKTATFANAKLPMPFEGQVLGTGGVSKQSFTAGHNRKGVDFVCVENCENDSTTVNRLLNNP